MLMTAIAHFHGSIETADQLLAMYAELRRSRNLGRRGRLDPANEDLLSLPKSAIVACMSALDAYIHSVLYEQIPIVLRTNPVPDALCDAMAGVLPKKKPTASKTHSHFCPLPIVWPNFAQS